MTEASTPQPSSTSEQLPWGISYLREDIQDLRQDLRENIQGVRQEIGAVHRHIDSRFAWTITTVIAFGGLMVALSGVIMVMIKL